MKSIKQFLAVAVAMSMAGSLAQAQTRNANPQAVGLDVLIPNTVAFNKDVDNNSNWEGYASKLGNGTLLLAVNTFGTDGGEVAGIVAIRPDGTIAEYAGFYGDDGQPFLKNMDNIRQDGNPSMVAGDLRPGGTKYVVANESTPMDFPEFTTTSRWNNDYSDHIWACQILELTPNGPRKVTNVIDPLYGGMTGQFVGKIRKGGAAFLSNGNVLVKGEDRTVDRRSMASIINGNDGSIIKGFFNSDNEGHGHDDWENSVGFDGGFAIRLNPPSGVTGGLTSIQFYDNDGNFKGLWEQIPTDNPDATLFDVNNPAGYTTSINSNSRGDAVRIRSLINGDRIYYAGPGLDFNGTAGWVYLTVIDVNTRQTIANIRVNEQPDDENGYDNFSRGERVSMDIDSKGNICVAWSDKSNSDTLQIVARIFDADLKPKTETFLAFQDSDLGFGAPDGNLAGVNTQHCDVAMTDTQILISARSAGGIIDPNGDGSALTKVNQNVFTVLANPFAATDVDNWSLF